jgi:hypothetical protein
MLLVILRASYLLSNLAGHGRSVAAVDPARCQAGFVHLGDFPDGGAGFGAAGLTSWSMTVRTSDAQQMGDAAVAGRTLGGSEFGAVHCPPTSTVIQSC